MVVGVGVVSGGFSIIISPVALIRTHTASAPLPIHLPLGPSCSCSVFAPASLRAPGIALTIIVFQADLSAAMFWSSSIDAFGASIKREPPKLC